MAKKISKKKKRKLKKMVIQNASSGDEEVLETPEAIHTTIVSETTLIIAPEVSFTKSSHEEARTSEIPTNVSDTGVNVTMGEVASKIEHQGSVPLPPFISPDPSFTHSPTFDNIIKQPFTTLFSS